MKSGLAHKKTARLFLRLGAANRVNLAQSLVVQPMHPANVAARIWLDGRTNEAKEWFRSARYRLRHGQHNEVIQDVQNVLSIPGLPSGAYRTLANLL